MGFQFATRNGMRVEVHVAAAFDRMGRAFTNDHPGVELVLTQGSRTKAEQTRIFTSRYVTAGNIKGRKVYDTRYWDGRMWFRISPAGTVAPPGTSNHEITGPNGPRSVDVRDTGRDAGVTVRGSKRDRWMQANAGKFGFVNEGYKFGEPWHKTFTGKVGGALVAKPVKRTAKDAARGRTGPSRKYSHEATMRPGQVGQFDKYTHGQQVTVGKVTTDVWFQGYTSNLWFWAGNFTSLSTAGMREV